MPKFESETTMRKLSWKEHVRERFLDARDWLDYTPFPTLWSLVSVAMVALVVLALPQPFLWIALWSAVLFALVSGVVALGWLLAHGCIDCAEVRLERAVARFRQNLDERAAQTRLRTVRRT